MMIEITLFLKLAITCFAYFFLWGFLVFHAALVEPAKTQKSTRPIPGVMLSRVFAVLMIAIMIYIIVTGAIDMFVNIALSMTLFIGAFTCWLAGNGVGLSVFETQAQWQRARPKIYLQAVGAVILLYFLGMGKSYIEDLL